MNALSKLSLSSIAEKYAADFIRELHLESEVEPKCEWSCLLWSREHWAEQARKSQIDLQLSKERLSDSLGSSEQLEPLFTNSKFMNTVAQVYSKLFDDEAKSCAVKNFANCPYIGQRQDLLNKGALATVFVTILHKAVSYAMLERHPLDSGLLDDEYADVYGINLTDFHDLEQSLSDGRFEMLFEATVNHAQELAGLKPTQSRWKD
jgi:hypothetical protein